ncbi:uncharacterized protein FTJAE_9734 [Fusarium tjaetaba]|uniref:Uncharacterized protein n=1 Tax=Fusarium tjaetaba TaxID=1567544 RepID=A0A8H5VIQ8_9HYPO|nr:uncharacterized protein FTJAE_9734 [Fusarium tjaetaba]KAF5626267.1 hypothetical protein FTJAE_9734 [Fusarium tjaetaba]
MQRHAFRSVCSRTRPELEQVSDAFRNYARQFSTTQFLAADGPSPSTPRAPRSPASGPKVIDIKSMPLRGRGGFRGRGEARGRGGLMFRGRGGLARGGSSVQDRSATPVRTSSPTRGRGGFGASRGRGGRGGRARGRGGRTNGRRPMDEEDKDKKKIDRNEFNTLDPDEKSFDDNIRFGITSQYTPSLTLESINEFAPVAPNSTSGKSAAVLQNLSVLGTADHVGAPDTFQPKYYASEIEANGIRFFADPKDKEATEKYLQEKLKAEGKESTGPIITDTEEAIRQVITKRAIQGQHETPKFASDPVGLSRSWHLRAETYSTNDVNSFETKLTSLLAKKPVAGKGAKARA